MKNKTLKILVLFATCIFTEGIPISELISKRQDLTQFYNVMRQINFFKFDLNTVGDKKYTVFAPSNAAFDKVPSGDLSRYTGSSISPTVKGELDEIMRYHTAMVRDQDTSQWIVFEDAAMRNRQVNSALGQNTKLFFRTIDGSYYVNGAELQEGATNLQADNGLVHIIDTFLYEKPSADTADAYIESNGALAEFGVTFNQFQRLLVTYKTKLSGDTSDNALDVLRHYGAVTVFVPSDDIFTSLKTQSLNDAIDDLELLRQIVESHVIPEAAYHSPLLLDKAVAGETIPALTGDVVPKFFSNHLEVSNQCAKGRVTRADITVSNGVIHVIDGILGHVYADVKSALESDNTLTDFSSLAEGVEEVRTLIDLPVGRAPPSVSEMVTVFAPIDSRYTGIQAASKQIHSSRESQEVVTLMHMIRGRVEVSQMENGTRIDTLRSNYKATFHRLLENGAYNTYVEVNQVRAKIEVGDICVLNGIVHKVDHVLGVPTRTIYEEIEQNENLRESYQAVISTGLKQRLFNDRQSLTFFAPSDQAFTAMLEDRLGRKLLDRANTQPLQNVLNRHLIADEVWLDDQGRSADHVTEFNDEKITVVKTDNGGYKVQFRGLSVPVLRHDIRMRNGVLHIIDDVLYSRQAGASEWTSASATRQVSLTLLLISVCLCLLS